MMKAGEGLTSSGYSRQVQHVVHDFSSVELKRISGLGMEGNLMSSLTTFTPCSKIFDE
jgi:hypothetical protein